MDPAGEEPNWGADEEGRETVQHHRLASRQKHIFPQAQDIHLRGINNRAWFDSIQHNWLVRR